jgi:hypothetical protein
VPVLPVEPNLLLFLSLFGQHRIGAAKGADSRRAIVPRR